MCRTPRRRSSSVAPRVAALPVPRPTLLGILCVGQPSPRRPLHWRPLLPTSSVGDVHLGVHPAHPWRCGGWECRWAPTRPLKAAHSRAAAPHTPSVAAVSHTAARLATGLRRQWRPARHGGAPTRRRPSLARRRATPRGGGGRHERPLARGRARGGGHRGACPAAVICCGRGVLPADGRCAPRVGEGGDALTTWPPPQLLCHVWGGDGGGARTRSGR